MRTSHKLSVTVHAMCHRSWSIFVCLMLLFEVTWAGDSSDVTIYSDVNCRLLVKFNGEPVASGLGPFRLPTNPSAGKFQKLRVSLMTDLVPGKLQLPDKSIIISSGKSFSSEISYEKGDVVESKEYNFELNDIEPKDNLDQFQGINKNEHGAIVRYLAFVVVSELVSLDSARCEKSIGVSLADFESLFGDFLRGKNPKDYHKKFMEDASSFELIFGDKYVLVRQRVDEVKKRGSDDLFRIEGNTGDACFLNYIVLAKKKNSGNWCWMLGAGRWCEFDGVLQNKAISSR